MMENLMKKRHHNSGLGYKLIKIGTLQNDRILIKNMKMFRKESKYLNLI